jgi:regulatory protein
MPTISDISPQKRDPSRYNVSVDGEYAFAISANALLTSRLFKGQHLTDAELDQTRQMAHGNRAYDQAMGYLSLRKRSTSEMRQYLRRKKEYEDVLIEQTIERLVAAGLINDGEFASAWIADRQATKPRSKRMLQMELRQKGLSSDDIEAALATVSSDDELAEIRKIAIKKAARYSDRQRLIAYLGSLGFSYDLIKQALEES